MCNAVKIKVLAGGELTWVAGYILKWYIHPQMVTHPSTNQARYRVTMLIATKMLPLSQAAIVVWYNDKLNVFNCLNKRTLRILHCGVVAMLDKVDVSEMQNAGDDGQNAELGVFIHTHHTHGMLTGHHRGQRQVKQKF